MTKPIGVGIIGLSAKSGWAATAHVPALRALPDMFSIVGLSASSLETAAAAADAHQVPFFTDDSAALATREDVDLVVVTVKVPHHRELVQAALDGGKSVYCEWPLARNLAEAAEMADLAVSRNVRTFVGLQARSSPAVRYIRDLVKDGYVGDVTSTNVIGSGGFPWGGVATAGMAYVLDDATGATLLTIPFGHMVDAFTWTLGGFNELAATLATQYRSVEMLDAEGVITATGPDHVAINGTVGNGAVASLQYRGGDSPATNFRWEIFGTKGMILIEGNTGHLQYAKLQLSGCRGDEPLADLALPASYRKVSTDPDGYFDTVAHAYSAVHQDLTAGSHQVPSFVEAFETHRLIDRIEQAAQWNSARR